MVFSGNQKKLRRARLAFLVLWSLGLVGFILWAGNGQSFFGGPLDSGDSTGKKVLAAAGRTVAQTYQTLKLTGHPEVASRQVFQEYPDFVFQIWDWEEMAAGKLPPNLLPALDWKKPSHGTLAEDAPVFYFKFHNQGRCRVCHSEEPQLLGLLEARFPEKKISFVTVLFGLAWFGLGGLGGLILFFPGLIPLANPGRESDRSGRKTVRKKLFRRREQKKTGVRSWSGIETGPQSEAPTPRAHTLEGPEQPEEELVGEATGSTLARSGQTLHHEESYRKSGKGESVTPGPPSPNGRPEPGFRPGTINGEDDHQRAAGERRLWVRLSGINEQIFHQIVPALPPGWQFLDRGPKSVTFAGPDSADAPDFLNFLGSQVLVHQQIGRAVIWPENHPTGEPADNERVRQLVSKLMLKTPVGYVLAPEDGKKPLHFHFPVRKRARYRSKNREISLRLF